MIEISFSKMTSLCKSYSRDEMRSKDGTSRKLQKLEEKKRKEEEYQVLNMNI